MSEAANRHIALVAYELENGGISRVAVYLANGFAAQGHRVTLLLCTSRGECDSEMRTLLSPQVTCSALTDRKFASRAAGQMACLPGYRRWLRSHQPDVILGTANNIAWFSGAGTAWGNAAGSRLYVKTTNPVIREKDGRPLTWLRRIGYTWLFMRCEKILALSDAEAEILAREFPAQAGRFAAVFNPYVTDAMLSLKRASDGKQDGLKLLTLGRFTPQKNMARLIRAFALARTADAGAMGNAQLTIAGDGPELAERKADARRMGLEGAIKFPGFCSEVTGLLGEADMFVLSSNYEGLPAVIPEALASGCRVVTTDCFPAARELLSGLPGCRVTARSAEALAEGIVAAACEPPDVEALRERAADYGLDSAVKSHMAAMRLTASP